MKKLNKLDLYSLTTIPNPESGFVALAAKPDGLYQKIGTVETKLALTTDNVASATKLQTARTIAGVSFDGTANIAIPFANLASRPTTLSGYGITDALLASSYTAADVLTKIKTVDGVGSGLDADLLDGTHLRSIIGFNTKRDFINGTLITTDIDYSVSNGDPFYLEIKGNTYGRVHPCLTLAQGYIYNNSIINYGVTHLGYTGIYGLIALNVNGKLCFWFPPQSYWEGYSIFVSSAYDTSYNRVIAIDDVVKPTGTKEVIISVHTATNAFTDSNVASASKLQTSRTIWGQSFNGSSNVTGAFSGATTGVFSSTVQATTAILTNLTTSYLPKQTASGLANSMIFDNGTNVGIGTATPSKPLTIQNDFATIRLQASTNPSSYFADITGRYDAVNPFDISINNYGVVLAVGEPSGYSGVSITYMNGYYGSALLGRDKFGVFVDPDGKVGIGTTNPTATLDVNGIGKFKDDILMTFNTWTHATDKNSLKKFLELFDIDAAGNLVVKTNLYSTGEVTAYSSGTGVSGLTLMADMNANGKDINNLTSISKSDSKISLSQYLIELSLDQGNYQFIFADDGVWTNTGIEASYFQATGGVYATEFKFGSWTFKQDASGRLGIYNGASEVACFNTDGTYVNL